MTYRSWHATFVALLVTTALLLVAATFAVARIVRQPDYATTIQDPSIVVQEKPFTMHGQSCDILVDGDSTASTGVDPRVITQQTGLTACNIASTRPIWDGTGTFALDAFLAHNPRPRVLLLEFGPDYFYRATRWDDIPPFAPYVLTLRQGSVAMSLRTIVLHPVQTVQVLQLVFKLRYLPRKGAELIRASEVFDRTIASFSQTGGRLNLELPALTACDYQQEKLDGPLDPAWIAATRTRYEALGIVTLVESSPLPACDPRLDFFRRQLNPVLDVSPATLPIGMFVRGGRHFTAEGATVLSTALAQQIKTVLQSRNR